VGGPDAAICTTGTTIKKAGSKEAFRSVDYDLPLSFARPAHQAGTQNFALVSVMGGSLGARSLTILRPGIIEGERDEVRLAESLVLKLSCLLAPVLPKRFQANPAAKIAHFRNSDNLL
jgi:hypothetical protein